MKRIDCVHVWLWMTVVIAVILLAPRHGKAARGDDETWSIPVVMEVATVRGKVVVLEDRRRNRETLPDLTVEVWSIEEKRGRKVKKALLYETQTSDTGFFELPYLEADEYRLIVSALQLRLLVVPRSENTTGEDPKILLIMVPKEVVEDDMNRMAGEGSGEQGKGSDKLQTASAAGDAANGLAGRERENERSGEGQE